MVSGVWATLHYSSVAHPCVQSYADFGTSGVSVSRASDVTFSGEFANSLIASHATTAVNP